jgi:hypothetical protein
MDLAEGTKPLFCCVLASGPGAFKGLSSGGSKLTVEGNVAFRASARPGR